MGFQKHRTHSVGMNSVHEANILDAIQGVKGIDVDLAIHSVCGSRLGIRRGAQAVVDKFLRDGGDLPLPDLSYPACHGDILLQSTVNLSIE